jgi:Leucine-rich repeat (LRR) protein
MREEEEENEPDDFARAESEEGEFEEQTPGGAFANFQERFEEMIKNEEVSDAIELNEKFMAEHLGVPANELSRLTKIELRVDTSCHNLQVTGEILSGLESLRMSDSIIRCFRDLGTSFRFVRFLYLQRCELTEVQGIQAFHNLEELYLSHNSIDDLFDLSFLEHLAVLDLEGNNVAQVDQLYYLKRCKSLQNLNLADNPVTKEAAYYPRV